MTKFILFQVKIFKMEKNPEQSFADEEPLLYHEYPNPGKYTIKSTKPMNNA
jgi:hypothetical protein